MSCIIMLMFALYLLFLPPLLSLDTETDAVAGAPTDYGVDDPSFLSNMLHYSHASSIEKNRRYLVIKGGLALNLC